MLFSILVFTNVLIYILYAIRYAKEKAITVTLVTNYLNSFVALL